MEGREGWVREGHGALSQNMERRDKFCDLRAAAGSGQYVLFLGGTGFPIG